MKQKSLMKSNTYTIIRFIAALLTILAIAGQSYAPKKRLLIHPSEATRTTISGYSDPTYGASARWIDQSAHKWQCNIQSFEETLIQGCGISLAWDTIAFKTKEKKKPTTCTNPKSGVDSNNCDKAEESHPSLDLDTTKKPCETILSDVDGDGWGLERGQRCKVRITNSAIPPCSDDALDHDANGWGWENADFCIVKQNLATHKTPQEVIRSTADDTDLFGIGAGVDFSKYDALKIKINYEGRAPHLRVYLRNVSPAYTTIEDQNSAKFMFVSVLAEDLKTGAVEISLSTFSVSQWWSLGHSLPRQLSGPEFNNIISIGMDHITPGLHKVRLDAVELTGEWIPMKDLVISVAILWFIYLILEAIIRYYSLRKNSQASDQQIGHLTSRTQRLEIENNEFKEISITDSLTGIFNRSGIIQFADNLFENNQKSPNFGVMVLDIDHFKSVNDTHGHDIGDDILTSITNTISSNLRENDIFGRWGGEEFVLICPQVSPSHLMNLAEKLRAAIECSRFGDDLKLNITISIGVTAIYKGDSFDDAFKRADTALYTAKNTRNSTAFQGLRR